MGAIINGSTAAAMPGIGLVEMTAEKRSADAAGNRAQCASSDGIANDRSADATGDRAHRAIAAAAAVLVSGMSTVMVDGPRLRDIRRCRAKRQQGNDDGSFPITFHVFSSSLRSS